MTALITDMSALAAIAEEMSAAAWLQRRAAQCCAQMLRECKTIPAARKALDDVPNPAVRQAAIDLFDRLAAEAEGSTT